MDSREERLQQRLRGAQRRQVKDVDFDLVFPAAPPPTEPVAAPQPAKSPHVELPAQFQGQQLQIVQEKVSVGTTHSTNDANTSAKRRKLDIDDAPTLSLSHKSPQNIPRVDIYELDPEDQEQDNDAVEIAKQLLEQIPIPQSTPQATSGTPRSPEAILPDAGRTLDEVTESPMGAPGSGHRHRIIESRSIQIRSQLQDVMNSSLLEFELSSPTSQRKRRRGGEASPNLHPNLLIPQSSPTDQIDDEADDLNEVLPQTPNKSVEDASETEEPSIPEELDNPDAEAIDDEEAAVILRKNQGRRKSRNLPGDSPDVTGAEISDSSIPRRKKRSRVDPDPVRQRHPKKPNPKSKSQPSKKKTPRKSIVRSGSPIPITVHRLRGEVVYDNSEDNVDILNAEIPRAKRGGVNCIDVLSGLCQEIVSTELQALEDGGNECEEPTMRREYKTKWNAVATFGKELQTRLLEHTINLDNTYSLERRLRDEQKKKLGLREEILRIRAEREQVALRTDEFRIKHQTDKANTQNRDALNNAVHDIELAIDLGKTSQSDGKDDMIGTELLLKRVADEVSNKGDSGGILKQIKEFNAFLERAALALESRHV